MRKTDKKLDNQIRIGLTEVCDNALKEIDGFLWLTHMVNYNEFPKSLKIVCVFESNDDVANLKINGEARLVELINNKLTAIKIKLTNPSLHIHYDSDEACAKSHQGHWAKRL